MERFTLLPFNFFLKVSLVMAKPGVKPSTSVYAFIQSVSSPDAVYEQQRAYDDAYRLVVDAEHIEYKQQTDSQIYQNHNDSEHHTRRFWRHGSVIFRTSHNFVFLIVSILLTIGEGLSSYTFFALVKLTKIC
jgi:hypothetical protein